MGRTKITTENSRSLIRENSIGDMRSKAGAWGVVYKFCRQNGMGIENRRSGIENVISFIDRKVKSSSKK